jgi:hypothetical protein
MYAGYGGAEPLGRARATGKRREALDFQMLMLSIIEMPWSYFKRDTCNRCTN